MTTLIASLICVAGIVAFFLIKILLSYFIPMEYLDESPSISRYNLFMLVLFLFVLYLFSGYKPKNKLQTAYETGYDIGYSDGYYDAQYGEYGDSYSTSGFDASDY